MNTTVRFAKCVNYGYCSLADTNAHIPIRLGDPLVCPECGKDVVLRPEPNEKKNTKTGVAPPATLIGLGLFIAFLVGLGLYFNLFARSEEDVEDASEISINAAGAPPQEDDGVEVVAGKPLTSLFRLGAVPATHDRLAPGLVAGFMRTQGCTQVAKDIAISGNLLLTCDAPAKRLTATITAPDPDKASNGLINKTLDLALTAERVATDKAGRLARLSDGPIDEHVVAIDAVAVIVHPSNPLKRLTPAQVAAIASGSLTSLGGLGGAPGRFKLLMPVNDSRSVAVLAPLLPSDAPISAAAVRLPDAAAVAAAVAADPAAIGIVDPGHVLGARAVPIGPAAGIALRPTPLAVGSEDYLLTRRLWLYAMPSAARPDLAGFIGFATKGGGQADVATAGFTPVAPKRAGADLPPGAPAGYAALVLGAERLTTTLRFLPGRLDFDARGLADIERVAAALNGERIPPERILVIGFADAGTNGTTQAEELARQVATALGIKGLRTGTITGFGNALPLGDASTPGGRNHNRRVEIWVRP